MRERNIAVCIVLSIITCGIYGIYWFISITNETNVLAEQTDTSGGVAFLLNIITCGIYGIYWGYKMGEKVNKLNEKRGMRADSNEKILYLVLCIVGLQIIVYALVQNEINKAMQIDRNNANSNAPQM